MKSNKHPFSLRFITSLVLFIVSLEFAVAQRNELHFRHINVENGLSSNTVWRVTQDKDGFMWFGTNDGLNKYDGYNFTIYRQKADDSLSLSSSRIIDILVADDGILWVGTADGLNCYLKDKNAFIRFDPPAFQFHYVRCLTQDHQDRLWVGTSDGLFQFDTKEKAFVRSGSIPDKPYAFLDMNIMNVINDDSGFLWVCTTEGLYMLENGNIFKASMRGKHPIFSSNDQFRDVQRDVNGDYWIATESLENGIYHFDSKLNFIREYSNTDGQNEVLAGNRVRVIGQLSDGKIWLGTYAGLSVYDSGRAVFQNYKPNKFDQKSLSHNSVRDIFEDRDGGIWLATYSGGINYYNPAFQQFNHVKEEVWKENSLSHNLVSGFAQDNKGNLWIGTEDGLNLFDISSNTFTNFFRSQSGEGLLDNAIKTIALDHKENLWIGSQAGLSIFDISNKKFQHFVHDPLKEKSIGYGHVHCIYQDEPGHIWIGTNGGGLNRYNPENSSFDSFSTIENEPNEIPNSHINTIVEDENLRFWIGTEGGLELFDMEKELFTKSKMKEDGVLQLLSGLNILNLYLEDEGNLWIGTHGNGLFIYNTQAGEVYTIDDQLGLPNNTVNGILEDNSGNFWISTNHGISKLISPENGWKAFNSTHIVNFNVTDGLQGSQFYPNSTFKSQDGQLYFGGMNGYNSFYAENVHHTNLQPDVVFTDIRFQNEMADRDNKNWKGVWSVGRDTILIDYSQSNFSIEFAALNYFDPEQTMYEYKLEPDDHDWISIGTQRVVNYAKLQPGDYNFKVKASNNSFSWGDAYSQLNIRIIPPFWRTTWAYFLYFIILSGLLYLFFTVATQWGKLKSDLSWEHLEREKEQDLHQMRIKFFTDISHELRTPLTLILAPLERLVNEFVGSSRLKNQLLMIQRNGERMLQLINQLLDLRKLETGHLNLKAGEGDIVAFVKEVSLAFREVALQKNINYEVHVGTDKIRTWFDRDKCEIVLYNLLSNAIKYTPEGGNIGLSLRAHLQSHSNTLQKDEIFSGGYVEISVEDDGRGIPAENLDKIFNRFYQTDQKKQSSSYGSGVGLEIVKKFVDLHKGKISVHSIEANVGQRGKTRFTIKLPIGRAHLSEKDIIENFKTSEDISLYRRATLETYTEKFDADSSSLIKKASPLQVEKARILVVEDNDEVRKFIVGLFESEYEVQEASNGEQGIEYAFENIPDLILSDIMMPGTDGLELCKRIKTDRRTSHVPVILLTARTAVTFQIEGMETGADDYITKPFSADLLKIRVQKLIEQRRNLKVQFGKGPGLIPENISITSVDEKLMKKAIDFINEHISDSDLTVEKVAGEVGLSRVHFYRKIKALTNLSAVEFIRLIRLERAAQLLRTGKLNVSEVRYSVGIQDTAYFRKSFKDHFGHTPSDYAKVHNSSAGTENTDL